MSKREAYITSQNEQPEADPGRWFTFGEGYTAGRASRDGEVLKLTPVVGEHDAKSMLDNICKAVKACDRCCNDVAQFCNDCMDAAITAAEERGRVDGLEEAARLADKRSFDTLEEHCPIITLRLLADKLIQLATKLRQK